MEQPTVSSFEGRPLPDPTEPAWDQGLAFDVETLLDRRRVLKLLGTAGAGVGLIALAACAPAASGIATAGPGASASATGSGTNGADCAEIPPETAGPFPGDGSNGPNILSQSGVVRADIRSSFGTSTTVAEGVPMTIRLTILDLAQGCAPFAGAAVYVWHCDRDGNYSMYSQAAASENYLRGVGAAGTDGVVTFQSIFPGCYPGRYPHIHFEVYPSLAAASSAANVIATSQVALPADTSAAVYGTTGYEASVQPFAQVSLVTDNVFGEDGGARQLGTVSGTIASGLTVDLAVPVGS
ncbi:MAG: 3,4-dioxygenase subunit beta [Chloroflexi bacterium]|nr:3,4-dioxygenase subunit beta [Chloroflexota bacterium]